MRSESVHLMRQAVSAGRRAYVLVNNRAEGNAPLTVQALTDMLRSQGRGLQIMAQGQVQDALHAVFGPSLDAVLTKFEGELEPARISRPSHHQ